MEADIQFGKLWFLGRFCYSGIERARLHDLLVADPIYRPLEQLTFPRGCCSSARNAEIWTSGSLLPQYFVPSAHNMFYGSVNVYSPTGVIVMNMVCA